jgi:VWFA-related protein
MSRLLSAIVMASMAIAAGSGQQRLGAAQEPGRLVYIDAVAYDRDDKPVQDLKPADIEVWIAGYRTPIEKLITVLPSDSFAARRTIVLLLDDITVPLTLVPRVKEAARRFVTHMRPGDQLAIVSLSGDAMTMTDESARLMKRIDEYNVRATGVMRIDDLSAQVLTTIASLARQFAEAPGRRKLIVGIGPSWLFETPIPPPVLGRSLQREWEDAMRALFFAGATFYSIDPGGVGTSRVASSQSFARETGGQSFNNTNDLEAAADRILQDAGNYYLIGLTDPPAHRKARLREVEVKVLRRGITVRARRGIPGTQD